MIVRFVFDRSLPFGGRIHGEPSGLLVPGSVGMLTCILSVTFLGLGFCNSPSSSDDEQPSDSPSSSFGCLLWDWASAYICFNKFLSIWSIFTSQNAWRTYLPTFMRSLRLKCLPAKCPRLAPAKEASRVYTNGILSLWNIEILPVPSLPFGIEKVQSWKIK